MTDRDDSTGESRPSAQDLFERYVLPEIELLLRVARSLTRNHADAEDLVQDTMLRAYRAIDRFDGRYPRAWLLTIMRNAQINRNRRRRPELLRHAPGERDLVVDQPARDVTDSFVERELDAAVEAALADLAEPFHTVVELVDVDGLSYAEAAEALGVPVGTVMSRLHRGRRRLKTSLHERGLAAPGGGAT